jgi:4-hydroxybenzoate polyprenyltransferase
VGHYLKAMRPKQWTKNLFIFAGIIFSGNLFNSTMLQKVFGCFIVFCLISGAVYLINDICDLEKDKKHPKKKLRPLPAGLISVKGAGTAAFFLTAGALSLAFFLSVTTGIITAAYFALMLLYSFHIKKFIILDVFTIALGFVLRVVAGVEVINIYLSPWAVVCTFFLALFLALGKRRNEKIILGDTASEHRDSLDMYTIALIDQMISIVATSTIVSYFLYTFKAGQHLSSMITIPFVLFGLFRYLFLVYNENSGGSPEDIIIGDRPLQLAVILWGAVSMGLLYWG